METVSASAATLQWLAEGKAIVAAVPFEMQLQALAETTNGGGLGVKVAFLCSGIFVGTVGPGTEGVITELLELGALNRITLTPATSVLLTCTPEANCTEPEVAL